MLKLRKAPEIILPLVIAGLFLASCSATNHYLADRIENDTLQEDACLVEIQPAPVPGSEIGPAQNPEGLPLYPGSIRTDYSKPPEWDAPTYAWYVIPGSIEDVFLFLVDESRAKGYVVVPKPEENQIHITTNVRTTITIDIYPDSRWSGYETGLQVFWYVDE